MAQMASQMAELGPEVNMEACTSMTETCLLPSLSGHQAHELLLLAREIRARLMPEHTHALC